MGEADRKGLQESLREIRESALGMIGDAETEVSRIAHRVLEGLGWKGDASSTVSDLVERVKRNRELLERLVDVGVRTAAARVSRPIAEELESVRARLEAVQKRLDELARRHPPDDQQP